METKYNRNLLDTFSLYFLVTWFKPLNCQLLCLIAESNYLWVYLVLLLLSPAALPFVTVKNRIPCRTNLLFSSLVRFWEAWERERKDVIGCPFSKLGQRLTGKLQQVPCGVSCRQNDLKGQHCYTWQTQRHSVHPTVWWFPDSFLLEGQDHRECWWCEYSTHIPK